MAKKKKNPRIGTPDPTDEEEEEDESDDEVEVSEPKVRCPPALGTGRFSRWLRSLCAEAQVPQQAQA